MAVLSHFAPRAVAPGDSGLSTAEEAVKEGEGEGSAMEDAEAVLAAGFRLAKLMCKAENNKGDDDSCALHCQCEMFRRLISSTACKFCSGLDACKNRSSHR
jgi:hypothetical protein